MGITVLRALDGPNGAPSIPPEMFGVKCFTMSPVEGTASVPQVAQRLWLSKFRVFESFSLATLSAYVNVVGATWSNYNGYCVYSDGATMNLLGSTVSDAALFATVGWRPKALQAPVPLAAGTDYWFGLLTSSTTQPQFAAATVVNANVFNGLPAGMCVATVAAKTALPATITKPSGLIAFQSRPLIVGY